MDISSSKKNIYLVLYQSILSLYNFYGSDYSNDYRLKIEKIINLLSKELS